MKSLKVACAVLVGILAAGCYNDFDTPGPRKLYTDEDMEAQGLTRVSIKQVKDQFGAISNTGTNNNGWANTKTLKFGALTPQEEAFNTQLGTTSLMAWPAATGYYIKGKVISSDRQGNIYKSLYIYDGTAAIELKLYNGLYMDYLLDLETMESQWVYVRLDGLYLGNYRMMLSIGGAPSDGINTAGTHKYYANSNLDNPRIARLSVFPGERTPLDPSDILEVDETSYTSLGEADLGRLVRFKNVKVRYATLKSGDETSSSENPYPSWIVTDWGTPRFDSWYRWAFNLNNIRLYGSVLISYNDDATATAEPGVYGVRTSGYSQFAMKPIPRDGTVGNVLGIYAIYATRWEYAQYQISVSRYEDLDFPEDSLLTDAEIEEMTPESSYFPPVKYGDDYDE